MFRLAVTDDVDADARPPRHDGDVTMVESIAIREYLVARYGSTPLAPDPHDPAFPPYLQFLHLGEAGLAASIYFVVVSRNLANMSCHEGMGRRGGQSLTGRAFAHVRGERPVVSAARPYDKCLKAWFNLPLVGKGLQRL